MKSAVRSLRVLFAVIALVPAYARAVGLYFETAATTSSATCPEPCFQIRMFIEDSTRNVEFQAIQMDVDVFSGGTPADLPVPPARNANADDGNINVELDEETIVTEIVANSLDSGATTLRLETSAEEATLTVIDDGSGMVKRELRRYHDIAASTKSRGEAPRSS